MGKIMVIIVYYTHLSNINNCFIAELSVRSIRQLYVYLLDSISF